MAGSRQKPCGRIGRERKLCRVKAVRTISGASQGFVVPKQYGRSDDNEGFVVSKPYGHIGR